MSKKLDDIRIEIDSIDNQVHDLLMRRADLVSSVIVAKKKEGLQIVQPAREARMMRRLLARHRGSLPRATIARIWRELVGSVALLQTGLRVSVFETGNGCLYWDMAKEYFGRSIPMEKVFSAEDAIRQVADDKSSFAVVPWPDFEESEPWWCCFFTQEGEGNALSIICALPYVQGKDIEKHALGKAVVVSKIRFMASDDDISFLGLKLSSQVGRERIMECAVELGLSVINLFSGSVDGGDSHIHLLEVSGFFDSSAQEIQNLYHSFSGECLSCKVVGGYPVILDRVR